MPAFRYRKRHVRVLDSYLSYVDTRAGQHVVLLLHGNPTSSYVWRDVIPYVQGLARCLAPDLLGFGDSGKERSHNYTLATQYRYLCSWLDTIKVTGPFILVVQDLGSMLGLQWAANHPGQVKAIVHMEAVLAPFPSYDQLGPALAAEVFHKMRHDTDYAQKVLEENDYLEMCISIMSAAAGGKGLNEEDKATYRAPFIKAGEARTPILTSARELPIEGEGPEDVMQVVSDYNKWLSVADVPKLHINVDPGLFSGFAREVCRDWPSQRTVTVPGQQIPQEQSAKPIGVALANFIRSLQDSDEPCP